MKNKEVSNLKKFLPVIVILLSVIVLVIAANGGGPKVETSEKLTTFYAVEDVYATLNITINNSATTYGPLLNITQINITLPSNITINSDASQVNNSLTDVDQRKNHTYLKTGNTLSWYNFTDGFITGGQNVSFWFNFSAATPGTYKFQVWIVNASRASGDAGNALAHQQNITVIVNDTTKPEIYPANITSSVVSCGNYSGVVELNVSVYDNARTKTINFTIINATGSVNASYNASVLGYSWNASLNTSEFPDGLYNITIWANDTSGNINDSAVIKNVIFDNTVPVITLTASTRTSSSTSFLVGISGALGGIDSACTVNRGTASVSGSGGSQTVTETGLECGVNNSYIVTCVDKSGLTGTSASFSSGTTKCGGSSPSGGSGGSSTTASWTNTFKVDETQFAEGVTNSLAVKAKMDFSVGSATHHVGVKSIQDNKVTIEIASNPIIVTLAIGEETKADVNEDGVYDVYVKLNAITNGKADVTIKSISEEVPVTATPETASGDDTSTGEGTTETTSGGMSTIGIIIIVLLVIAGLIGAGVAVKNKSSKKRYSYLNY